MRPCGRPPARPPPTAPIRSLVRLPPPLRRSNRTKGLKILRCFPHCCPEHIDRSYCGTSLSVRVQLEDAAADADAEADAESPGPPPSDRVSVFARFEAMHDVSLREGECVEVHKLQAAVQSEANLEGQWIPGQLDRPSGLVTTIRSAAGAAADPQEVSARCPSLAVPPLNRLGLTRVAPQQHKPLVFHLNAKAFSRWYYDWESGANKAQRLMKHVLKAYIMERCAVDDSDNFTPATSKRARTQLLRVMAVVSSPEFTVISYRRAPSEVGAAAPAANSAPSTPVTMPPHHSHQHQPHGLPDTAPPLPRRYEGPSRGEFPPARRPVVTADGDSPLYSRDGMVAERPPPWAGARGDRGAPPPPKRFRGERYGGEYDERAAFEQPSRLGSPGSGGVAAAASVTAKNLALLYAFLRWAPLSVYAPFADELNHLLHHKLIVLTGDVSAAASPSARSEGSGDAGSRQRPAVRTNCFSRALLEQTSAAAAAGNAVAPGASAGLPYDVETLLRVVAQTALWLFSSDTRGWLRAFLLQYAPSVLDKHALQSVYVRFLQEFEQRLDVQVFASTPLGTVANAAEEVIATVYSLERFHDKRPLVRRILSAQGLVGWRVFVAQMREVFISSNDSARSCTSSRGAGPTMAAVPRPPSYAPLLALFPPRNATEHCWTGEWVLDTDEASWRPTATSGAVAAGPDVSLWRMLVLIAQLVRVEVALSLSDRLLCMRSTEGIAGRADCMRFVLDGRERVLRLSSDGVATAASSADDTDALGGGGDGDYIAVVQSEGDDRFVVYLQLFRWGLSPGQHSYYTRLRLECWRDQRLYVNGEVLETSSPSTLTPEEQAFVAEMRLRGKRKAVGKAHLRHLRASAAGAPNAPPPSAWRELGKLRLSYSKAGDQRGV